MRSVVAKEFAAQRLSCAMKERLLPLIILAATALSGSAQVTKEVYKVRAAVVDVSQLQQFKGSAERTLTPDPRVALTLRIESIAPTLAGYTNGSLIHFAIHSPALIGLDKAPKAKTYDFVLSHEVRDGARGPWWFESPAVLVSQPHGAADASQPASSETNRSPAAAGSRR